MRCPKCQSENAARAKFCNDCGTRLEQLCPSCRAANPLGGKFCSECGQLLGASQAGSQEASPIVTRPTTPREERRWATLLFADLSGFTKLSEELDPEDVKALAHRCTQRLGEEAVRFGG